MGNSALKPERTNELEFGFDAELKPADAHLAFTFYNKVSHDALINVTLPPTCGCGTSVFRNLGSVANKGVEISAAATVIRRRNVNFDVNASANESNGSQSIAQAKLLTADLVNGRLDIYQAVAAKPGSKMSGPTRISACPGGVCAVVR